MPCLASRCFFEPNRIHKRITGKDGKKQILIKRRSGDQVVFSNTVCFPPYLGKWSNLTSAYVSIELVQPPTRWCFLRFFQGSSMRCGENFAFGTVRSLPDIHTCIFGEQWPCWTAEVVGLMCSQFLSFDRFTGKLWCCINLPQRIKHAPFKMMVGRLCSFPRHSMYGKFLHDKRREVYHMFLILLSFSWVVRIDRNEESSGSR